MSIYQKIIELHTEAFERVYDITSKIEEAVEESRLKDGHCIVQALHTTASVFIQESEQYLKGDILRILNKIAPKDGYYEHDNIQARNCPPDEPINGHSHIKASLLGHSIAVGIKDYKLLLGKWQSILFSEFDGPRYRQYLISIYGE